MEVRGRTVRYLEGGTGWPLLLLHAFPLAADMWRPQLESPPDGWRVLAPDVRGFGPTPSGRTGEQPGSSGPPLTISDFAHDIVDLLDALEIERAALGGLSMGGYITFACFRAAPERFLSLILANTKASADTPDGRTAREAMSALLRDRGRAAVADDMIPKLLGETSRRTRPELASRLRTMIESNSAGAIDQAIHAMKDRPDSTELLPRVGRPALVIAGEEDTLIPVSASESMHRLLPRSQLVVLPGAGHVSNLETAEAFSEALENFLRANL